MPMAFFHSSEKVGASLFSHGDKIKSLKLFFGVVALCGFASQ
jgi:hypothetical protein